MISYYVAGPEKIIHINFAVLNHAYILLDLHVKHFKVDFAAKSTLTLSIKLIIIIMAWKITKPINFIASFLENPLFKTLTSYPSYLIKLSVL